MWVPIALLIGQSVIPKPPPVVLQDAFGRDLRQVGITLVDWEGRIANPAIRLKIVPGDKLYLPARVRLTASNNRLMFNLWSEVGPDGPTKTIFLDQKGKAEPFLMSIFPDPAARTEDSTLKIEIVDANESATSIVLPVHVVDQDQPDRPIEFPIKADFSYDRSHFFDNPRTKDLALSAIHDWAYFLAEPKFDAVPAGVEKSFIFDPSGFENGHDVTNSEGYTGLLLYFVGITGPEKRSGAVASEKGAVQTINGKRTGLKRSGTVAIETTGNWNGMGWLFLGPEESWWEAGNMSRMKNDFVSVVHHEMGHSIINHRVHPAFNDKIKAGRFVDQTVRRYLGGEDPKILDVEHFFDTIDPVSRVGVFGNEYGGDMPRKRWLVTKFDLLVMQSCGYRLRDTSPFERLNFDVPTAPVRLAVGDPVNLDLNPSGGIPTYFFRVSEGKLPNGLTLDSFTGRISGSPKSLGDSNVTIQLRDNDPTRSAIIKVLKFNVVPAGQARG